ncbi:MAG: hypothetical protein LH477_09860 [Nocardioides sp.]|nr:hypothetical protein [Nocardioides sp.]
MVAALPTLLDILQDRTGPVALVEPHRGAGHCSACQVDIAGEPTWFVGFTDDEHTPSW